MFLGLLIMLVGISWLISLITAVPADATIPINPIIAMFGPHGYSGPTSGYLSYFFYAIQGGEWLAFVIILGGFLVGIVGYRQE